MLVIDVVREANLPTMLYTVDDPALPGPASISAVGASLLESGVNQHAVQHERLRGNPERMLPWIRGASAVARMRRSAVMLWGGTYSLHMEHLQDDIPALKRLMIRDILIEGEYALIRRVVFHWEFVPHQCFAYKGMKNIGVIEDYECGVVYRVACWIDSLGIKYSVSPQVSKCLMLPQGFCAGDFRLELK